MARTCIGIDLGSRNLRLVAGTVKGTVFTLTKIAQVPVPISDDPESATLAAIPELGAELGEKLRKAATGGRFGLSGKELIIRYTQVPPVPLWRLRLLMDFEVREMAQQAGDALASDYNLITLPNAADGEDTVLVAVCKESFLNARFDAVRQGIGMPESALPSSLALFNAFVGSGEIHEGEYTFLVDLGDRNVELALQRDGELIFARNIATGGRALTEAVASALGTSTEDAEGLKHQFGQVTSRGLASYTSGREEKVGNAIIGPVGQLSAMIQSSLAFIRAQTKIRDLEIGRILLSGGGANLRGLTDYLSAAFKCPVARFQPEAGLDTSQLLPDEAAMFQADPGSFAIALGLARTSADPQAFRLDLAPEAVKKKRRFVGRTLFMWMSGVAALFFLALTLWRGINSVTALEGQAQTERRTAETLRSRRKLYDSEVARIADLNQKMAHMSGFTEPAFALLTVQGLVQRHRPESVWIDNITVKREAVPDPANTKNRIIKTLVRVTGLATPMGGQPDHALQTLVKGMQAERKGTEVQIVKQTPARGGPIEFELLVDVLRDPYMNLGDVWQEHRRFITIVGAGGLILLIGYFTINAIYSGKAGRLSSDIDRARTAQRQAALPPGVEIKKIQSDRERLEREAGELITSVGHKPADRWLILPSVADPDLHYNQQIDTLRNGVLELAARRNIDVDQRLGLPDTFPGSRGEIEHYLRGLDVIEVVASTALAAEQRHESGVARIERIEIVRPPKARPANERKVPFVTAIRVDLSIIGHPKAIDWFLKNFAADAKGDGNSGRYLAVEEASIKSLDLPPNATGKEKRGADPLDRRRIECRMSILALNVNPEGQVL